MLAGGDTGSKGRARISVFVRPPAIESELKKNSTDTGTKRKTESVSIRSGSSPKKAQVFSSSEVMSPSPSVVSAELVPKLSPTTRKHIGDACKTALDKRGTWVQVHGPIAQKYFDNENLSLDIAEDVGIRPRVYFDVDQKSLYVKVPGEEHDIVALEVQVLGLHWSRDNQLNGTSFELIGRLSTTLRNYGEGDFGFSVRGFMTQQKFRGTLMTIQGEVVSKTSIQKTLRKMMTFFQRPEASLFILVIVKSEDDASAYTGVAPRRLEVTVFDRAFVKSLPLGTVPQYPMTPHPVPSPVVPLPPPALAFTSANQTLEFGRKYKSGQAPCVGKGTHLLHLPLTDIYWPTADAVAAYGLAPVGKPPGFDYLTIDMFDVKARLYTSFYQSNVYP